MLNLDQLDFDKGQGFVTVVCQDHRTGAVLMVARADREAMARTLASGEMHYHSRTRGLWHKGATSGHVQRVVSLSADCDGDAVLARVIPTGPACHTGATSCFGEMGEAGDIVGRVQQQVSTRQVTPPTDHPSYTQRLFLDRNLRLKKLGEEAMELAISCADQDGPAAVTEAADLVYHTMVALTAIGVEWHRVQALLAQRHKPD